MSYYGGINARVARGAAWLDEVEPGWERRIDLDQLNIASARACICGQVFTSHIRGNAFETGYDYAAEVLYDRFPRVKLPDTWLGFEVGSWVGHHQREYDALALAWMELIKERFNSGILSDQ